MKVPRLDNYKQSLKDNMKHIEKIEKYLEPTDVKVDFFDEKAKIKFVKYIESLIRNSYEYKNLISFLKEKIDMNHCSYFHKLNGRMNHMKIEIHHSPLTLYDLVFITINKFLNEGYELDEMEIAEHVMLMHYEGNVGLVPLSQTVHEMVHNDIIFVPIHYVFGDLVTFFKNYSMYMTDELKGTKINKNIEISKQMEDVPNVLQKDFVYLEIDGMELPKKIEK